MTLLTIFSIGIGGFIGAVLRSWLNGVASEQFPNFIAIGTLSVNLLGSLILGAFIAYSMHVSVDVHIKSFISTGLLGALTTYSTFAVESFLLLEGGSYALALSNILLNVIGTITFAAIGFKSVKMLI